MRPPPHSPVHVTNFESGAARAMIVTDVSRSSSKLHAAVHTRLSPATRTVPFPPPAVSSVSVTRGVSSSSKTGIVSVVDAAGAGRRRR